MKLDEVFDDERAAHNAKIAQIMQGMTTKRPPLVRASDPGAMDAYNQRGKKIEAYLNQIAPQFQDDQFEQFKRKGMLMDNGADGFVNFDAIFQKYHPTHIPQTQRMSGGQSNASDVQQGATTPSIGPTGNRNWTGD